MRGQYTYEEVVSLNHQWVIHNLPPSKEQVMKRSLMVQAMAAGAALIAAGVQFDPNVCDLWRKRLNEATRNRVVGKRAARRLRHLLLEAG